MKALIIAALATFAALAGNGAASAEEEECQALFVHSADEISFDGSTLTMSGASPTVIFFCDRPVRFAGHLTIDSFFDTVSTNKDPFSENPPNAVLSVVPDDGDPVDIVVTILSRPEVNGDKLSYSNLNVLDGEAGTVSGPGALFIDRVGRPMSPGSVAGVHRRHDRRKVRRCDRHRADGIDCKCGPGLVCY